MSTEMIVWGCSGHAKVLRPIIVAAGRSVVAAIDRNATLASPFGGAERLHTEDDVVAWTIRRGRGSYEYVVAIGGAFGIERCRLASFLDGHGGVAFTALHSAAFVAPSANVGTGCHVMAMAVVGEEVVLGVQTIVNTSASVDHECRIGAGVHIMPGATLAGCVVVGDHVTIGSNATIFPRIVIGDGAQVGAGAVVNKDILPMTKVVGVPARAI